MEDNQEDKNNLLIFYAKIGNLKGVRDILENEDIDITSTDDFGDTALHAAAISGKVEVMDYLISRGANINSKVHSNIPGKDGTTPIFCTVIKGHIDATKILLNKGADTGVVVNKFDLLDASIESNNPQLIDLILGLGYCINRHNLRGETPLAYSLEHNKDEAIKLLLEKGADYRKCSADGSSPLARAVLDRTGNSIGILLKYVSGKEGQESLSNYVNYKIDSEGGRTPLHIACVIENYFAVKILLSNLADPSIVDDNGFLARDLLVGLTDQHRCNQIKSLLDNCTKITR